MSAVANADASQLPLMTFHCPACGVNLPYASEDTTCWPCDVQADIAQQAQDQKAERARVPYAVSLAVALTVEGQRELVSA